MIYLDHAATTQMSEKALEVYVNVATHYFGNANSLHDPGAEAKQILEASAKTLASTINATAKEIYFTSGATEANYLSIYSLIEGCGKEKGHLITSSIEHSSVRNVFLKLEKEGFEVSVIPVDKKGQLMMEELKNAIRPDTLLASIQHVNSETGVIQDLPQIGELLHEKGVLLHSDCVQSYGRLPINVDEMNADAITWSAHKIYGPKGAGAAWLKKSIPWKPVIPEENHAKKFKPGTADVASIAAFATAAKQLTQNREAEQARIREIREQLIQELSSLGYQIEVEGNPASQIPNILGLRFLGMEGQYLMLECAQANLAISTGSACNAGSDRPSSVMMATGKNEQEAREFVRLSFGMLNNLAQIPEIKEKMNSILERHFKKVHHQKS